VRTASSIRINAFSASLARISAALAPFGLDRRSSATAMRAAARFKASSASWMRTSAPPRPQHLDAIIGQLQFSDGVLGNAAGTISTPTASAAR
jgi:hypothetical protein